MTKTTLLALAALSLLGAAQPVFAQEGASVGRSGQKEFLGIDLDNGGVYYNGYNSGRYCVYRTVDVYNRYTGYVEARRVRRCGRGLYLP